jgi:hypothetical protein
LVWCTHPSDKGVDKSPSLKSQQMSSPKKCCGNLKVRYRTLRKFSRKQHFIMMAQTQWTHVQRLSPRTKGSCLIYPCKHVTEAKKQSLTHIWLHVTSLAILFPQCYVTFFMFQFFKFYLSVMPSLPPATLSEHRPSLFFFWTSSLLQQRLVKIFENIEKEATWKS